jgi:hypothetical protein
MITKGKVTGIIANLVTVEVDGPVTQNEICYINLDDVKLMAEVIKIGEKNIFIQVFESTRGVKSGTEVIFTGHLLEATLGPGILSKNFDGLQHDLNKMDGVFLKKGDYTPALEADKQWTFTPLAEPGEMVAPGSWLGEVTENWIPHKIMVPFSFQGTFEVKRIVKQGEYKINDTIAVLIDEDEQGGSGNHGPKVACENSDKSIQRKTTPLQAYGNGCTRDRQFKSNTGRRNRFYSRAVWNRENRFATCPFQTSRGRSNYCCCLWGTCQ